MDWANKSIRLIFFNDGFLVDGISRKLSLDHQYNLKSQISIKKKVSCTSVLLFYNAYNLLIYRYLYINISIYKEGCIPFKKQLRF